MIKHKTNPLWRLFVIGNIICIALLSFFAVRVFAQMDQTAEVESSVLFEAVDISWANKNNSTITSINLPDYMSPGEVVSITPDSTSIFLQNKQDPSYVRFKITATIDGLSAPDLIHVSINSLNSKWVLSTSDNYYYYCGATSARLTKNTTIPVINSIALSDEIKKTSSGKVIHIVLTAEAIDAKSQATQSGGWASAWGNNPPDEWFTATNFTRPL